MSAPFTLRPSTASDADWMVDLRAIVMRPDLERVDRWDPNRVRERFLNAFDPAQTSVILIDGSPVGLIAVRKEADAVWIEHFYLDPNHQGLGIGGRVLAQVMASNQSHLPFRLNVLLGSPARRLYERHGFRFESQDEIDVYLTTAAPVADRLA